MINYLPQPDRHRTEETQQTKQYKLTKQRNHLPMITELIITDKDVRGKYRTHEYSQH